MPQPDEQPKQDETPLCLCTEAQIAEELCRRNEAVLLITLDRDRNGTDPVCVTRFQNFYAAIGLAQSFVSTALADHASRRTAITDEPNSGN